MEITFNEIKIKEIISTQNGKRLGRAGDIVFSKEENKVLGLIVPGEGRLLRKAADIFIPINSIERIGDDVILVRLENSQDNNQIAQNKIGYQNISEKKNSYIRFKKTKLK